MDEINYTEAQVDQVRAYNAKATPGEVGFQWLQLPSHAAFDSKPLHPAELRASGIETKLAETQLVAETIADLVAYAVEAELPLPDLNDYLEQALEERGQTGIEAQVDRDPRAS